MNPSFKIAFGAAEYPFLHTTNDIVVVVDILRATSTIVRAFMVGAKCIIPVATVQEARLLAQQGYPVGGERDACKLNFARWGNDPEEYTANTVAGRSIVLTTTNGTQAIEAAYHTGIQEIVIGAFANLGALAQYCHNRPHRNIVVIASGWKGRFCLEDVFWGGALLQTLQQMGATYTTDDSATMALDMYRTHHGEPHAFLSQCDHNQRLLNKGFCHSLSYCLQTNITSLVPYVVPAKETSSLFRYQLSV